MAGGGDRGGEQEGKSRLRVIAINVLALSLSSLSSFLYIMGAGRERQVPNFYDQVGRRK